mgnify:CR=1 FL=1|jgi:spore coat polysaccharide biosynthesis protein SpsF (cytidylyltransferase family)|tara:strand:- start:310 stop:1071 length:762 start_codon:yes stop_codon:yes gene_type:complete
MNKKTVILVAVRLKSKRLKRKALLPLNNIPLILQLTDRIKKSNKSSDIIWCTSFNKEDDPIASLGRKNKIKVFRGSEKDVMSRFILAAKKYNAKNVVRVTGDNPLTDPKVIDFLIEKHNKNKNDYTCCNSIPMGTRPEVISLLTLKKCHKLIQDPDSTEYMTWMLNRPDYFKVGNMIFPQKKINRPNINLTIDTKEDYKSVSEIYTHFKNPLPSLAKIIKWIDARPALLRKLTKKRINKISKKNINFKFKDDI